MSRLKTIKHHYDNHLLKGYTDKFAEAKVLVIGDIILDEYFWGNVTRISPEAPVPVVEVKRETRMLGGAANVIRNIATLGATPVLCGVIGKDRSGRKILNEIKKLHLTLDGIITEEDRPTSIKTRVVARNQQVVRFDRESRSNIRPESIQELLGFVEKSLDSIDAIVVSDYGKGVISAPLMKGLRELVQDDATVIAVDPKTGNFEYYYGVDVITPNHHEAGTFCRFEVLDKETLDRAGRHLLRELDCRSVLITQGKEGMTLFENSGDITHIPTHAKKVYDVTGAGDTVIATFSLGLAVGLGLRYAAIVSNLAAGIVVGEVGTSAVSVKDLKQAIDDEME